MKSQEQIAQKLKYCEIKISLSEGQLSEDPDVVYNKGYKDALVWIMEENNEQINNENPQEGQPPADSAL